MTEQHKELIEYRHVHFIGIGGIGMSGLGELTLKYGYEVSGSDLQLTPLTERLSSLGATIYAGHKAENLAGADLIVYSSAIPPDNPELLAALRQGIVTINRADFLGTLTRGMNSVAVAGTHGKTSTSGMIVKVLTDAGLDPTAAIGGIMTETGSNMRHGHGTWMIVEADEYDRSFHSLTPSIAVITSIDDDHLEYYGSQSAIDHAFVDFAHLVPVNSPVIICADDPGIGRILPTLLRPLTTYGRSRNACIRAEKVVSESWKISADVFVREVPVGRLYLPQPGECNLLNALATLGVADHLKIPVERTLAALSEYRGLKRRFEVLGQSEGIKVVDDYAHHPAEIEAALLALAKSGAKRLFVIFQPHLYSRTRNLAKEFGQVFGQADVYRTVITDVYPAREKQPGGVSGELILEALPESSRNIEYIADKENIAAAIIENLEEGDMVVTLGAGDINMVGRQILFMLRKRGA